MRWSLKILQISGIGIFIHWTFVLLLLWIAYVYYQKTGDPQAALDGVLFILALFGCVVLHELGHALTAKRFGIKTRDITILPIGGLARLERIPEDPKQELLVAIAGPAVNVVLALIFWGIVEARGDLASVESLAVPGAPFLDRLLWVNVFLTVFNLLPAFPMDGGRVLRALLAMRFDYVRATEMAASVGQFMAIAFGIVGLFGPNPFLIIIAFFVFMGAQQEAHLTKVRAAFQGVPVRSAMMTRFRTLSPDDTIGRAIDLLLSGSQQDFPVVEDGRIAGLLLRRDLFNALRENRRDAPIESIVRRDLGTAEDGDLLDDTFQRMRAQDAPALPVVRGGELVGLITLDNVGEWLFIRSATRANGGGGVFGTREPRRAKKVTDPLDRSYYA